MAEKTLVSPDGSREWKPRNASEAVNLKARGWSEKTDDAEQADKADQGEQADKPARRGRNS